jgi:hypothetical protein
MGHDNHFCEGHYQAARDAAASRSMLMQMCVTCGAGVSAFPANNEPMSIARETSGGGSNSSRSSTSNSKLSSRAPTSSQPMSVQSTSLSVDDDISGPRWDKLRASENTRRRLVVKDCAPTVFKAFRKRYGLKHSRDSGVKPTKAAMRTCWRVTPEVVNAANNNSLRTDAFRPSPMNVLNHNRAEQSGKVAPPLKAKVGYVVMVPLPIKLADDPLGDRHPLKLAEMYVNAFTAGEAWRRLRVLLAVNLRDDWRLTKDTTEEATTFLKDYVAALNQAFVDHDLPARAVGVLWGVEVITLDKKVKRTVEVHKDAAPIHALANQQPKLSTDDLRKQLAELDKASETDEPEPDNPDEPADMQEEADMQDDDPRRKETAPTEFPFATVRSLLVQCRETTSMRAELLETCDHVFLHTGDGDLVSLWNDEHSLFAVFDQWFSEAKVSKDLARVGGCTVFDRTEVRRQLVKRGIKNDKELDKSVLLTLLAKTLDTCFRGILDNWVMGTSYFAEPNTLINADMIEKLQLGTISNEDIGNMPDWGPEITRRILLNKCTQETLPGYAYQLRTSSRAALVVLTDSPIGNDFECVHVHHNDTVIEVLRAFCGEHNTQIRHTQISARLKEAKVGEDCRNILPDVGRYGNRLLRNIPGGVLNAVWIKRPSVDEAVVKLWNDLALRGTTFEVLEKEIYRYPNDIYEPTKNNVYVELNHTLWTTVQESHVSPVEKSLWNALVQCDVVFQWALGVIWRIKKL